MKEYDKRKSHIYSKIHVIYISSNNVRHPVAKTVTTCFYFHLYTVHVVELINYYTNHCIKFIKFYTLKI